MTGHAGEVWKSKERVQRFLEGVRAGIPLAAEQIDVMLRLIEVNDRPVERFLDLGCGDGVLGRAILSRWPAARGLFLDYSEPMLEAARRALQPFGPRARLALSDYADPRWTEVTVGEAPFDAVVSGFSIHHQPDETKRRVYRDIYELLQPGGLFVHLEHVTPDSDPAARAGAELFIDSLWRVQRAQDPARSREEVAEAFRNRSDKEANILAPLDHQLEWLRDIGFHEVACHLKVFELAVFSGRRPPEQE